MIPGANDFLMTFVVMASAAPSPACLACGELSQKRDRRVLGGSNTSEAVILLWKRVISKELQSRKQEIDLDRLLSPGLGYVSENATMLMTSYLKLKTYAIVVHNYSHMEACRHL